MPKHFKEDGVVHQVWKDKRQYRPTLKHLNDRRAHLRKELIKQLSLWALCKMKELTCPYAPSHRHGAGHCYHYSGWYINHIAAELGEVEHAISKKEANK